MKDPERENPPWYPQFRDLAMRVRKGNYRFSEEDGWLILKALNAKYQKGYLAQYLGLDLITFRGRMGTWAMKYVRNHGMYKCYRKQNPPSHIQIH